jgi:dihydroflavonol-4-reductase
MRALVTGATGKVGHAIASALLDKGDQVRALVRDPKRAASVLPAGIEPVKGDVTDVGSLAAAVEDCELVFNSMGMPEQWVRDEAIFDQVNAIGSQQVAVAAKRAGVRRFVHTSTHDVFHADTGERFDETMLADYPKGTAYERSKQHAEELVLAERDGMEVVILNPSGVYGPTPSPTPSFENEIFEPVVRKRLPAVPPGGTGYAFVEGVAAGHLLAAELGKDGERYILADGYADFRELAETAKRIAGRGRIPPRMPVPVAKAVASLGAGLSKVTRRPPLLPKGQLEYILWQARPDSSKAQRELGWRTTPLDEGVQRTLHSMGLLSEAAETGDEPANP